MLGGMLASSGCGSLSSFSRKESIREQVEKDPRYSIDNIHGPTGRAMNQANWLKKREDLVRNGDPETTAALSAFDAAQALYDAGKFKESEKAFKKVAKERRDRYESFATRFRRTWGIKEKHAEDMYGTYGDSIEEDALYMMAEAQYAQKHYADAQESYEDLLVRYPSTRYLDLTTRQLFRIARYWLDFPEDIDEKGEAAVKLASTEDIQRDETGKSKAEPSALSRVPVLPNLTDETRPLFDTHGRGEQALRSIWLHDATGPLADDALMLAANHNLRTEDYVEARRLYALLREQYPDSPHLKDAYMLGSHVTLASYQGPAYDGSGLESARELKQELLALFPSLTEEERKRLKEEIDTLEDAEVARTWDLVDFYRIKRNNAAIKLHCYQIINKYPDSQYAEQARAMLKQVEKEELAWANSPFNFNKPTAPPVTAAAPQTRKGETRLPDSGEKEETPAAPTPAEEPAKPKWFERMNPLRPVDKPPQLEKPPEESPGKRRDDLADSRTDPAFR